MKHNFTKKLDLIIHGYDDDWDDNDEHDDTENVNEMEDINAMIESSNPEYCEQKTLQFQTVLKIMPGDILDYGTMLLDFAVYVKRWKMLI